MSHDFPVIIAGSRTINDYRLVLRAIEKSGFSPTEVVCGKAKGVDTLGERWAKEHNVPIRYFPADWKTHGRAAGPIRNREMAEYTGTKNGGLILLWTGNSSGSRSMKNEAEEFGLLIHEEIHEPTKTEPFREKGILRESRQSSLGKNKKHG